MLNPFGILFNPFSIMNALERMLNNRPYTEDDLVFHEESWISFDHHGRFNGPDKEDVLAGINEELEAGRKQLLEANAVFITLGSAWVYEHEKHGVVANCHKVPNKQFTKRMLSHQECHLILRHIPQFLASHGISADVVFTLSPVRHWKDGPVQNSRSKATLLSALHAVVDEFESCHYFPAYELMMDDLRDYRFYTTDMLHPSPKATEYIWERFKQGFFGQETHIICSEVQAVIQASQHKPMDPESNSFQRFVKKQLNLVDGLEKKYPQLDLSKERAHFTKYKL